MTEQEFNTYFQDIATRSVAIGHTPELLRFSKHEDLARDLRHKLNSDTFLLVATNEDGRLSDTANLQTIQELHSASFAILKKTAKEDTEATKLAYTETFQVANSVISRMLKDFQEGADIMRWLDTQSFSFQKVGPIAENHFGYEISFSLIIKAGCNYAYQATDWNE